MKKIIYALAISFCFLNSFGQNEKIDSLMQVVKVAKEDTNKAKALIVLSKQLRQIGDIENAIRYTNDALILSQQINFKKVQADAYNSLGIIYLYTGNYIEALKNDSAALRIYKEIGYKKGVANSYSNLSVVYAEQGDIQNALVAIFEALNVSKETGDENGIASSYNNIAELYRLQGNYPKALESNFSSLKISEESGDKKGIALSYNNVANAYVFQRNYQKALKYYFASLKIRQEAGDKYGIAASYDNIGIVYLYQLRRSEALKNHLEALKIRKEIEDNVGIARSFGNIANVYHELGDYSAAQKYYSEGLKFEELIGDKNGIAQSYNNLGGLYIELKKYNEAKKYLMKGLSFSKETGNNNEIMVSYNCLARLDSATGNWKDAYLYHKLYIQYRDTIFNEENTKKIVQTQMQYDFDKKEASTKAEHDKKAALAKEELKKQKIIRNSIAGGTAILVISSIFSFLFYKRKREASFKNKVSEVEMKALRSQMNPHFIFNSLNSIKRYMANHDNKTAEDYLTKFASVMRMILENSEHKEVPLQQDLKALELYMQLESLRMKKKFNYEIKVDESIDSENTLVPPLILQPFVENSIWHGLAEKEGEGKITISINKIGEMIECTVEDNGVGRKKSEETKGRYANIEKKSLGMKITNARIDILNKIKKSKAGVELVDLTEGMRVVVKLPLELSF